MEQIPVEILGQIYYWIGPNNLQVTSKYLYKSFYTALKYTIDRYNIVLPYEPNNILEHYKIICALREPVYFGSDLVNRYYQSYKLASIGIEEPPRISDRDEIYEWRLELLRNNKSYYSDGIDANAFLHLGYQIKQDRYHLNNVFDANPLVLSNAAKYKLSSAQMPTNQEYYNSVENINYALRYAYAIQDFDFIYETAKTNLYIKLAGIKEFEIYQSHNKVISIKIFLDICRWNRWDLYALLKIPVESVGKVLSDSGTFLSRLSFPIILKHCRSILEYNKECVTGHININDCNLYQELCTEYNVLPYPHVKDMQYFLNNKPFKDYVVNSELDLEGVELTLYDEPIELPKKYYMKTGKFTTFCQAAASYLFKHTIKSQLYGDDYTKDNSIVSLFGPRRKCFQADVDRAIEIAERHNNYYGSLVYMLEYNLLFDINLNKKYAKYYVNHGNYFFKQWMSDFDAIVYRCSKGLDNKMLKKFEEFDFDDSFVNEYRPHLFKVYLNNSLSNQFEDAFDKLYPDKIPDADAEYFLVNLAHTPYLDEDAEETYPPIFDKLSDQSMSKLIPMFMAIQFQHYSNELVMLLNYVIARDTLTINYEYFVLYYPSICLVGVEFLLKIWPVKQVKTLLKYMLKDDLVPQRVKTFIETLL